MSNYGLLLCQRDRMPEALKMFELAAANTVYQTPEIAYNNAGTCLLQHGDLAGAEQRFRQALQVQPKLPQALLQMARISFDLNRALPGRGYLQRYAEVASHTSASLWLGIRIERVLGDRLAISRYEQMLEKDFPDSQEARLLLESRSGAR
jgi:type IV pilus assembly protein PilF